MERGYKYRIYPNKAQRELIAKTFGCCRFVYNHALDRRRPCMRKKEYHSLELTAITGAIENLRLNMNGSVMLISSL